VRVIVNLPRIYFMSIISPIFISSAVYAGHHQALKSVITKKAGSFIGLGTGLVVMTHFLQHEDKTTRSVETEREVWNIRVGKIAGGFLGGLIGTRFSVTTPGDVYKVVTSVSGTLWVIKLLAS
jgi:hypothetical protein